MKKLLTVLLLCGTMFATGCEINPKIETTDVCYDKPPLNIEHQQPLKLIPIKAEVIRVDGGQAGVFLSGEDFSNWILNNKSIESYIRIDKETIDSYHEYYIKQEESQPVRNSR